MDRNTNDIATERARTSCERSQMTHRIHNDSLGTEPVTKAMARGSPGPTLVRERVRSGAFDMEPYNERPLKTSVQDWRSSRRILDEMDTIQTERSNERAS